MQEKSDYPLRCPLTFTDAFGREETVCFSNGQEFVLTLRGANFKGPSFNNLEPDAPQSVQGNFQLDAYLCPTQCLYEVGVPLRVRVPHGVEQALLFTAFDYNNAGGGSGSALWGTLTLSTLKIHSTQKVDVMEYLLMDLQLQLPEDFLIHCCLSCRNSHYSPFGANDIGDLFCFRDYPDQLNTIARKSELLDLWEIAHNEQRLYRMQETYWCRKFTQMTGNEWNYKDWNHTMGGKAHGNAHL